MLTAQILARMPVIRVCPIESGWLEKPSICTNILELSSWCAGVMLFRLSRPCLGLEQRRRRSGGPCCHVLLLLDWGAGTATSTLVWLPFGAF